MSGPVSTPGFDLHAESYDADLNEALSVTGEDKQYFASRRVRWLAKCLARLGLSAAHILDYGCGTGDTTGLLQSAFGAQSAIGVDISMRSIEVAAQRNGNEICRFMSHSDHSIFNSFDLAYCNGVFHHIPLDQRSAAVEYIFQRLRPGAIFSFWENNPWNPGTRYVMAQCVFDHDAVTIAPPEAKALLREQGFEIVRSDFCFFFPRFLSALRFAESSLSFLPLGAQYQILCRKPVR